MSLLIGLTGGIGSGKSMVAEMFRQNSAIIISADLIARDLIRAGKPAWKQIVEYFGNDILLESNEINRSILGEIIFDDFSKRKILESILHPRVIEEEIRTYESIKRENSNALVILESALLIESGSYKNVDRIVLILCGDEERIRRLIKRDAIEKADAQKRLNVQMNNDKIIRYADYVINNDGSIKNLEIQVEDVYSRLLQEI